MNVFIVRGLLKIHIHVFMCYFGGCTVSLSFYVYTVRSLIFQMGAFYGESMLFYGQESGRHISAYFKQLPDDRVPYNTLTS